MDLFGQPDILKMISERDYEGLRRLMEHDNPIVRLQAAQALADLGDGGGWRSLEDAVRNGEDMETRMAAAAMLGELGDARAVPVLQETLSQLRTIGSAPLARELRRALEAIATPEAEEALREAGYEPVLAEQHHTVIEYNDHYVKSMHPQTDEIRFLSAEEHLNNAVELREAELAERGLVEANLALWLKPNWGYAWYVRGVLFEDLERPLEAMLSYRRARDLDSGHAETREALTEVEEQIKEEKPGLLANPDLAILLNDLSNGSWQVRRDSAALLGEVGDRTAIDALIAALNDDEREVRHAALEALGRFAQHEPIADRAAPTILQMEESSWLLRFTRLQTLAEMRSVEGLVGLLHGEMDSVQNRNPVFHADKDPLLEVEYELIQEVGVRALEHTGDIPALLALAEQNAWVEEEDELGAGSSAEEEWVDEDEEWETDPDMLEAEEAEENLESYVDETSLLITAALDRLASRRLPDLPVEIVRRLAEVPDLTLLDLEAEDPETADPVIVYDLSSLRSEASKEITRRGG